MQFRNWVLPASVGITSFGLGAGCGYLFKKVRTRNFETGLEDLKTRIANLEAKNGETKEREEDLRDEMVQLEFKFEDRQEKLSSNIQQVAHVVKDFTEDGLQKLKHAEAIKRSEERRAAEFGRQTRPTSDLVMMKEELDKIVEDDEHLVTVFKDDNNSDWDYEKEVLTRERNVPYILHRDEYFAEEKGFDHRTLVYYKGDDILCDENDVPIHNADSVVGERLEFGHGSQDESIVFIRNEVLEAEYEVIVDHGYFQVEVLGNQIEDQLERRDLKHSIHKFRME